MTDLIDSDVQRITRQVNAEVAAMSKKPKKTIKVYVALTVEVDVDDYRLNYGVEDVKTIRSDIKDAVVDAVNSGGVLANGIIGARAAS